MRIRVLVVLLGLIVAPLLAPTAALAEACPCWPAGVPLQSPLSCYAAPGGATNHFAYVAPPAQFMQVTSAWCRVNASYTWLTPAQRTACAASLQCLCSNPAPGPEQLCNATDDDCNPATPDQSEEVCDNGVDDDCDGDTDGADADCNETPLGTNLAMVADYASEQPFVDAFKSSRVWIPQCQIGQQPDCTVWDTGEAAELDLDAHGWVRSLPAPEDAPVYWTVGTLMFRDIQGHYPGGPYVVLYDGTGTLEYGFDAVHNAGASTPGRDVLTVTPSDNGIYLKVTATDPAGSGDYLRNIRVVPAAHEASHAAQPFSPDFLAKLAPYRVLRFMDWMQANNSSQRLWADRPVPADARYATPAGVPLEVMADLANRTATDAWFTLPHRASDHYVEQFASLALARLDAGRDVTVEYSNEVWNGAFTQGTWVQQQAEAEWPGSSAPGFTKRVNWHGKRTAEICEIWKGVWSAQPGRVTCVLGAQASNDWVASQALDCPLWSGGAPCSGHGISAIAIGPYFGRYLGIADHATAVQAWTTEADGGLGKLFTELSTGGLLAGGPAGGAVAQATGFMSANLSVATARSQRLLAYEGGQHLVGVGSVADNAAITDLFIAANRDPRMGPVYTQHLEAWKALGAGAFMHFTSVGLPTKFGSWGALEYPAQGGSPKYDALVGFAAAP